MAADLRRYHLFIIDRNPWRKIERHAYTVRDRVLTVEEQAELVRRLSPRLGRWLLFMIGTGVRLEECRGIDPKTDLRLTERWVRVTGKFGKTRTVPLPMALVPIIQEQLQEDGGLWRQNPQRLREVLTEACRARKPVEARTSRRGRIIAGQPGRVSLSPPVGPHTLRPTFGWRWLTGGGDIYTLSKILGHASIAVTERHYAHLLKEDIRAKADRVELGLPMPTSTQGKVLGWPGGGR